MIDTIRDAIRGQMTRVAKSLNTATHGKLTPNMVSCISLLGHGLVFWALLAGDLRLAAPLLLFFGLMDALDGALARLKGKPDASGMLLDASSDKVKESIVYIGLTQYFLSIGSANGVRLSIAVLAGSLIVSYVKAKGETALSDTGLTANEKNRALQDGFARYEVRMAILIIGLLFSSEITLVLFVLLVLVWVTAVDRFRRIYLKLR